MTDKMTPEASRQVLVRHLLRKVFLEDWALKLFALVITLALWVGVTGLSSPTTSRLTVPLNLNISSNAQITNEPQGEVTILISGDKRRIEQINRSELTASIDLTDMPAGDRIVSLTPDVIYVPLPQGVKVIEVETRRIAVKLETVEEKELEVKVETKGAAAAGYEVYSVNVVPSRISVRGPASIVRMLEYVQTERIDLAGKKEDFSGRQIPVISPNPQAAVLNTFVDVFFRIGEKRVERMFSVGITGESTRTATFILYGARSVLSRARTDQFTVELTKDEFGTDSPRVILPADWPKSIEIREVMLKP
ncbi:MAG: CdaR family protein [Pyrinomonadaceae bacterium]